ncbi:MAG: TolC family protein [Candidatus Omnitrophica bacterium]|nr:TolC family protein [Candidatus Omnitrophota bacterium]
MYLKRIILFYFFLFNAVTAINPTISYPYNQSQEDITQYIVDLSKDIHNSIQKPDSTILSNSKGEVKLKLFLSPWGELKDVYVSESSGSRELDGLCLKTVWLYKRYQPFPEKLGDKDLWIDVPIIFEIDNSRPDSLTSSEFRADTSASLGVNSASRKHVNLGINDAIDIALENHMAAKIAQEEIELSKLKIREARRALYPAASMNYLETTGKTAGTTQDFTDKEYKLKFEYPLYYGWRLKYAVEQAMSNLKASTSNYEKALQDLRGEVELAFYAYMANKMDLKLHKTLLEETDSIFTQAKKRLELGLITRAEFLQLESQMQQINYQVISSENELAMAKLTLAQAVNIKEGENAIETIDKEPGKDLEPIVVEITLEECIDSAFRFRPDLKSKEYMLEFNDYERKITESKNQLKVDLTGTYGKSGGAYETESMTMGNDWYIGLKASKPLGGNTLSTAFTKDKTSQKHGQSSRTESVTKSVELGLLDGLQHFSEEKSAEIGYKKAKDELEQVRDSIIKEVKESYLNYKKGLVQIMSNLNKIKYKEEELKVIKSRAELNEVSLSELAQAYMGLTDEKAYYIETLGSLYQSLAKLNKATGYALFLDDENFKLANTK